MNYLRKVDFEAFQKAKPDERVTQWLIDESTGGKTCTMSCIKTPAGGGSPAGMHTHKVDQAFYIVSGTMSVEIQGETSEAGAGSVVIFPAGVPHRNWNAGSEPTIHLAINTPAPDPALPFATPA